ncbi:MAG: AAA family ATPase [Lachnospiraceae bacterium]|nr:AAA family ATPase [Lachnospiraceae bacterium]
MADELGKSWYTKYRPATMEEYSGPKIKDIVSKRFTKRSNMPHVIMIHGSRGCGKTTFARIISKYYLCQNPAEDGTPCEECEMCQSINEILIGGESSQVECPGVTELDATIMNGKEAIQEVLDEALQSPIYSDFKVLIVDECHMISNAGQNSMLKIIEDIPSHLVVIFATTDPQKVLQTIKSRCQLTLEARKQSVKDMADRLMQISQMEGLTVSKEALEIIARKGNRVPRECINLLEGIAKTYDGEVTVDNVREHLGGVSSELYMEYFTAANKSLSAILIFIKKLKTEDVKLNEFVSGLMAFALDSMYIKHGISLEDYPVDYVKAVKELFDIYGSSDFDMLLQILEYLSNNLTAEDEAKNELLLTTTAMRISKIQLLANGLAKEQSEAITENKISLYEHSQKLKVNNADLAEQMKMDVTPADLSESFDGVTQVINTQGLLDSIQLPKIDIAEEEEDNTQNMRMSLGNEIDEFFDNV